MFSLKAYEKRLQSITSIDNKSGTELAAIYRMKGEEKLTQHGQGERNIKRMGEFFSQVASDIVESEREYEGMEKISEKMARRNHPIEFIVDVEHWASYEVLAEVLIALLKPPYYGLEKDVSDAGIIALRQSLKFRVGGDKAPLLQPQKPIPPPVKLDGAGKAASQN